MGLLDKLFGGEKKSEIFSNEELVEAGACPNCWGVQEYDNTYIEYMKDPTRANVNNDPNHQKAFVAQFMETHVTGIKLKTENGATYCPKCNTSIK